jgi:hypothetical protein
MTKPWSLGGGYRSSLLAEIARHGIGRYGPKAVAVVVVLGAGTVTALRVGERRCLELSALLDAVDGSR